MSDPIASVVSQKLLETPAGELNSTELSLLLLHARNQEAQEAEDQVEAEARAERKRKRVAREAARAARVVPAFDKATQIFGYVVSLKRFEVSEIVSQRQHKKGTEVVSGRYT